MTTDKEAVDKAIIDFECAVGNYQRSFGSSYSVIDRYKAKRDEAYIALKAAIAVMEDARKGAEAHIDEASASPQLRPVRLGDARNIESSANNESPYKQFFREIWNDYCDGNLEIAEIVTNAALKYGLAKEEKYDPLIHREALGDEWGLEEGETCYVLAKPPEQPK